MMVSREHHGYSIKLSEYNNFSSIIIAYVSPCQNKWIDGIT
jgi:hypothetical protein